MDHKTAYIEQNGQLFPDEKKIVSELNKRNIPIVYFSKKQLLRNKIEINNPYIVSAGLTSMKHIFSYFNIPIPVSNSYPNELNGLYKRKITTTTLGESFRKYNNGEDFFIKPKEDFKSFTGFIISEDIYTLHKLIKKFKPNYLVHNCSVVNIKSEHRVYVANNVLLESSHYFGDDTPIDINVVESAISTLSKLDSTPNAYVIDFAVTDNNQTIVLEFNEGFSIDSYECSSLNYFNVIKTRWDELYSKRKLQ